MRTERRDDPAAGLAAEAGADLDRLLASWAERQRLSAHQAETIRLAVVRADAGFDAAWWQELFRQPGITLRAIGDVSSPLVAWRPGLGGAELVVMAGLPDWPAVGTPTCTYLRWAPARP